MQKRMLVLMIAVTLERRDALALMSIEDTGAGIDSRQQARIFDEFYRIESGDSAHAGGAAAPRPGGKVRIYAVDDDPVVVASLTQLLQLWGYEVRTAADADGVEALFGQWGALQLLVSDLDLGAGLDGLALAVQLRARHGEFPLLLVCGDMSDAVQERARAHGAALLRKPVSAFRLRRQIERMLWSQPR